MKKIWKTEEGVSPVIATILMVAITVVLAAVLYVMVIGMTPPDGHQAPAGAITFNVKSATSVEIDFGTFSPTPTPTAIKIIITNNSDAGNTYELTFANAPDAAAVDMLATGGASAVYTDMNYNGNAVNSGDFITVDGLGPHTSYTVKIYHYGSDSLCSLVGETTFNLA